MVAWAGVLLVLAGCKTDLNQQLLERELRMQEDQIYHLQDQLLSKNTRLERTTGENASLRRQLGIGDGGSSAPGRGSSAPTFVSPPPLPKVSVPGLTAPGGSGAAPSGLRFGPGGSPSSTPTLPPPLTPPPISPAIPPGLAPPKLDGVPPLPSAAIAPPVRRLSFEESLDGEGRISHLIVNPARTECFDADGDGVAEGLALVIEPRDADERLVTAAGDVVVFVNDPALPPGTGFVPAVPTDPGEGGCIARWDIPEAEAQGHFRRTSRARGLHFLLRWPGPAPQSSTVYVHVVMTTFDGRVHRVDVPVTVHSVGAASARSVD
ncbi:MAG: hypothetical protein NT171_18100 [Planctomycetota bacterium]|nr:hypothetical protein [Planctomycetota bacterium]